MHSELGPMTDPELRGQGPGLGAYLAPPHVTGTVGLPLLPSLRRTSVIFNGERTLEINAVYFRIDGAFIYPKLEVFPTPSLQKNRNKNQE